MCWLRAFTPLVTQRKMCGEREMFWSAGKLHQSLLWWIMMHLFQSPQPAGEEFFPWSCQGQYLIIQITSVPISCIVCLCWGLKGKECFYLYQVLSRLPQGHMSLNEVSLLLIIIICFHLFTTQTPWRVILVKSTDRSKKNGFFAAALWAKEGESICLPGSSWITCIEQDRTKPPTPARPEWTQLWQKQR